jgi:hypothetical protein
MFKTKVFCGMNVMVNSMDKILLLKPHKHDTQFIFLVFLIFEGKAIIWKVMVKSVDINFGVDYRIQEDGGAVEIEMEVNMNICVLKSVCVTKCIYVYIYIYV